MKPGIPTPDILVLGAGAAGLTTAIELAKKGLKVQILEARDRVGGRVWTQKNPKQETPLEKGAEFIHGWAPETVEVLQRHSIPYYRVANGHFFISKGRLTPAENTFEDSQPFFQLLSKSRTRKTDRSFKEFLLAHKARFSPKTQAFVSGFVEGFHGANLEEISEKSLAYGADQEETSVSFRILGGYDRLIEAMAKEARDLGVLIQLESVVQEVIRTEESVKVTFLHQGKKQRLEAQKAVVTLPIGVLRLMPPEPGAVSFSPPLPRETLQAIRLIKMARVCRVSLRFSSLLKKEFHLLREVFAKASFLHFSPRIQSATKKLDFPTWWTLQPLQSSILTLWAGGGQTKSIENKTLSQIQERAFKTLSAGLKISQASLKSLVCEAAFHDWDRDPYARGSYSYMLVGGADAPKALTKPIEEKIYFAGEATVNKGRNATVNAAIISGLRVAKQIIKP